MGLQNEPRHDHTRIRPERRPHRRPREAPAHARQRALLRLRHRTHFPSADDHARLRAGPGCNRSGLRRPGGCRRMGRPSAVATGPRGSARPGTGNPAPPHQSGSFGLASLNLLIRATRAAIRRPWRVLGAAALVCAVSLALAIRLEIRSSFEELLPADLPSVAQIKELSRRMGGDGNVLVNVESVNGPAGLPRAQALARVLAGEILSLGPDQVRLVEHDVGAIQTWYQAHWPMFASVGELTSAREALREEIRGRRAEANPLVVSLDEEESKAEPQGRIAELL